MVSSTRIYQYCRWENCPPLFFNVLEILFLFQGIVLLEFHCIRSNQIFIAWGLLFKFCISPFNYFFAHQSHFSPSLLFLHLHHLQTLTQGNKKRKQKEETHQEETISLLAGVSSIHFCSEEAWKFGYKEIVAALQISMADTSCDFLTLTERQVSSEGDIQKCFTELRMGCKWFLKKVLPGDMVRWVGKKT